MAANGLDENVDMTLVEEQSRGYYKEALPAGMHIAYLVLEWRADHRHRGVSFFRVMPTYHDPTGWKAYIMNMYTDPRYRRRGIATHTLGLLVGEAKKKGVRHIALEATAAGLPGARG